jgi:membrane protease YdiL (CAAX protease family)
VQRPSSRTRPDGTSPERGRSDAIWPAFAAYAIALFLVLVATVVVLLTVAAVRVDGAIARIGPELARFGLSAAGVMLAAGVSAVVLIAVALVAARLEGRSPRNGGLAERLRLGRSRATATGLIATLVGMVGLSLASGAASELLAGHDTNAAIEQIRSALSHLGFIRVPLAVAAIAVGPGIAEEIFFRGFLQKPLIARWGRWPGIAIAAFAFGLMHLDLVQGALAVAAGLLLGWVAERFESIRPAIAAHVANNAMFVVLVPFTHSSANSRAANLVALTGGTTVLLVAIAVLKKSIAIRPTLEQAKLIARANPGGGA